jgi:hypothetical protein
VMPENILVCTRCHDRDADIIGCEVHFLDHVSVYPMGNTHTQCCVCGIELKRVVKCNKYKEYAEKNRLNFKAGK